jgi:hypothetical protein
MACMEINRKRIPANFSCSNCDPSKPLNVNKARLTQEKYAKKFLKTSTKKLSTSRRNSTASTQSTNDLISESSSSLQATADSTATSSTCEASKSKTIRSLVDLLSNSSASGLHNEYSSEFLKFKSNIKTIRSNLKHSNLNTNQNESATADNHTTNATNSEPSMLTNCLKCVKIGSGKLSSSGNSDTLSEKYQNLFVLKSLQNIKLSKVIGEFTGKVMLLDELDKNKLVNHLARPYFLIYKLNTRDLTVANNPENSTSIPSSSNSASSSAPTNNNSLIDTKLLVIDASNTLFAENASINSTKSSGQFLLRKSCKPNTVVKHFMDSNGNLRFFIETKAGMIQKLNEITLPFDLALLDTCLSNSESTSQKFEFNTEKFIADNKSFFMCQCSNSSCAIRAGLQTNKKKKEMQHALGQKRKRENSTESNQSETKLKAKPSVSIKKEEVDAGESSNSTATASSSSIAIKFENDNEKKKPSMNTSNTSSSSKVNSASSSKTKNSSVVEDNKSLSREDRKLISYVKVIEKLERQMSRKKELKEQKEAAAAAAALTASDPSKKNEQTTENAQKTPKKPSINNTNQKENTAASGHNNKRLSLKQEFMEKSVKNEAIDDHNKLVDQEIASIIENGGSRVAGSSSKTDLSKLDTPLKNNSQRPMCNGAYIPSESPDYSFVNLAIQPRQTLDLLQRNLSSPTYKSSNSMHSLMIKKLESLENDVDFILHHHQRTNSSSSSTSCVITPVLLNSECHQTQSSQQQKLNFFNPKKHWLKCSTVEDSNSIASSSPSPQSNEDSTSANTYAAFANATPGNQPPPKKRRHVVVTGQNDQPGSVESATSDETNSAMNDSICLKATSNTPRHSIDTILQYSSHCNSALTQDAINESSPVDSVVVEDTTLHDRTTSRSNTLEDAFGTNVSLNPSGVDIDAETLNQQLILDSFYRVQQALAAQQMILQQQQAFASSTETDMLPQSGELFESNVNAAELSSNTSMVSASSSATSCCNDISSSANPAADSSSSSASLIDSNNQNSNSKKKVSLAEYRMRKDTGSTTTTNTASSTTNTPASIRSSWASSRYAKFSFDQDESRIDSGKLGEEIKQEVTREEMDTDALSYSNRKLSLAVSKIMEQGLRNSNNSRVGSEDLESVRKNSSILKATETEIEIEMDPDSIEIQKEEKADVSIVDLNNNTEICRQKESLVVLSSEKASDVQCDPIQSEMNKSEIVIKKPNDEENDDDEEEEEEGECRDSSRASSVVTAVELTRSGQRRLSRRSLCPGEARSSSSRTSQYSEESSDDDEDAYSMISSCSSSRSGSFSSISVSSSQRRRSLSSLSSISDIGIDSNNNHLDDSNKSGRKSREKKSSKQRETKQTSAAADRSKSDKLNTSKTSLNSSNDSHVGGNSRGQLDGYYRDETRRRSSDEIKSRYDKPRGTRNRPHENNTDSSFRFKHHRPQTPPEPDQDAPATKASKSSYINNIDNGLMNHHHSSGHRSINNNRNGIKRKRSSYESEHDLAKRKQQLDEMLDEYRRNGSNRNDQQQQQQPQDQVDSRSHSQHTNKHHSRHRRHSRQRGSNSRYSRKRSREHQNYPSREHNKQRAGSSGPEAYDDESSLAYTSYHGNNKRSSSLSRSVSGGQIRRHRQHSGSTRANNSQIADNTSLLDTSSSSDMTGGKRSQLKSVAVKKRSRSLSKDKETRGKSRVESRDTLHDSQRKHSSRWHGSSTTSSSSSRSEYRHGHQHKGYYSRGVSVSSASTGSSKLPKFDLRYQLNSKNYAKKDSSSVNSSDSPSSTSAASSTTSTISLSLTVNVNTSSQEYSQKHSK